MAERLDQLAGRLVALPARAEAAVDDFLEVIAARQSTHIAATHRIRDVATQQHRRDQAQLIDVVALLPPTHSAPRNLRRCIEDVERIRGDAALAALVGCDTEVTELELLVLADEDVEGRQ